MSKGSKRRPQAVSDQEMYERWDMAFQKAEQKRETQHLFDILAIIVIVVIIGVTILTSVEPPMAP